MGLSIHYNGQFKEGASLSEMIEEVQDIAEIYKWKYNIYETDFPESSFGKPEYNQNIYGISFTPPECETVSIAFLSNGKMSSPVHLKFFGKKGSKPEEKYLYMLSTKTQFAGIEVHKLIIHLFKYLSKKYLTEFNVTDDGQYWETGDEKVLQENFSRYNDLLDSFSNALENYPIEENESIESYFERLMREIHNRKTGK